MPLLDALYKEAYSNWDDAETLARVGRYLHNRNRLDDARVILERALELDPGDARAWTYLSFCYFRSFRSEKGLEVLRKGIETTDADRLRSTLLSFSSDDAEKRALRERLEGSEDPGVQAELQWPRITAGDLGGLDEMRRLVRENPELPRLRDSLMWALLSIRPSKEVKDLDLREEGVPLSDRKIREEPEDVYGHWMKAQMHFAEEDWDGVLAATGAALEEFPDEETQIFLRGRAFKEQGKLDHAILCFSRAIGMKPSYVGARTELGKAYEEQEKFDLAEQMFRESPKANPAYPGAPMSLALFLGRRGRWAEAEKLFCDSWAELPPWIQGRIRDNPDARPLLEREAVQTVIGKS
jgi:tetratricopeptide (TPR) repeat protein